MSDLSESRHSLNLPVFIGAASIILLIVLSTALFPKQAELYSTLLQTGIMTNASWFYVTAVAIILIGVAIVGLSRYGDIKLGPDHSEPDFSFSSWFAMLFSAGMGIGLMFFGVAEPVMHFLTPLWAILRPLSPPGNP